MTWVWDHSQSRGNARLAMLALADTANDAGICWPSIDTLAHKMGVSESTARRQVQALVMAGELEIEHVDGRANRYRIVQSDTVSKMTPLAAVTGGGGVTVATGAGVIATTPEPSLTVSEEPPNTLVADGDGDGALPGLAQLQPAEDAQADEFERWWVAYPRKVNKGGARKAWKAARKKAGFDQLMAAVERFALQCRGKDQNYIPHAQTWLNGERWDDEAAAAQQRAGAAAANGNGDHWRAGGGFWGGE